MSFADLGLCPEILRAVAEKGYDQPSPIQEQAIPAVLQGRDIMAAAQTGTGKTAGFTLPMLQLLATSAKKASQGKGNQARALILTPTRELAAQIEENVKTYSQHLNIRSTVVFGGVKINPQMQRLRGGVDILVATPGRLLDLYQQRAIRFDELEILVLDEADRMLDMGFIHDIRRILKFLPAQRQNLMFSATFSDSIRQLAKTIVNDPIEVSVSPENTTAELVEQWIVPVDKGRKPSLLSHIIKEHDWHQVLVFSRTKHGANRLARQLTERKINAAAIHGNKSQGARTRALAEFKSGEVRVLVATDIAARGLDIHQLPHVINFDLPNVPADYVHRIGRTGRAGAAGQAVSFVCHEELVELCDVQNLIGEVLERKEEAGFEPTKPLPETKLNLKPKKIKKPKQQNQGRRDNHGAKQSRSAKPQANRSRRRPAQAKSNGGAQGNR